MRLRKALLCLVAFIPLALGDVGFTSPSTAGDSFPGGSPFTVKWADSGVAPSISDLTTYQLALYTGSNAAPVRLLMLAQGAVGTGTASVTVPPGIGGSTANAYFLQMTSVKADGGSVINFSSRFTLTNMAGTFTPDVITALGTVTGTAGPPTQLIPAAGGAAVGTGADGQFGIPYNEQTGLTKYAPMQPLPPTSITQQNTSPLWPTSSVPIATTFLPIPSIQTTITQNPTYAFTSHENTAAAQSQPTGDMQKFLNRWKD